MSSGINLVQTQEKSNVKRKKRTYLLKIISLVFAGFVGLLSIILFVLSSQISLDKIKKEEENTLQKTILVKDKAAKFSLTTDRLKSINQVLATRKNYTGTLNSILEQIPDGVSTTALSVDKGDVSLTVNSSSLLLINKFLNSIVDSSFKKHVIRDMSIEGLTIDKQTGFYSLSIKAKII